MYFETISGDVNWVLYPPFSATTINYSKKKKQAIEE